MRNRWSGARRIAGVAVAVAAAGGSAAAPAGAQEVPLTVDAEVRVRPELDARTDEPDASPGVSIDPDFATLLRTRLGLRAEVSDGAAIYIQIQDSRAFGEETSTLADGAADALDMHQAYVDLTGELGPRRYRIRAGRQEIRLANERLVGAVGWTNTGRSFDAVRGELRGGEGGWRLEAWIAQVDENDRVAATGLDPRANEGEDEDHAFYGLGVDGGSFQLYVLHDRNAEFRSFDGVDRTTLSGRVARTAYGWLRYEFEAAYQAGNLLSRAGGDIGPVEQDIAAWMATGRLAWVGAEGAVRELRAGLDYLSGDAASGGGDYEAFNTLYATNHKFYGFMDFFTDPAGQTGDRGLVDGLVGGTARLSGDVSVDATLHRFWLAEEAAGGVRSLGTELDVTVPWTLPSGGELRGGYSLFANGEGAPVVGLGDDGDLLHWAYLQLTVRF